MTEVRRTLGVWQGVALYAGSVLGTGVLVLPAIAARTAGPGSLFAWAGLILLSAPMAFTFAALSVQRPDAGGFSGAIERAFGARWGAVAGWLFVWQIPTGSVVAGLIAGESFASVFGGGAGMAFASGMALMALGYLLNFAGLKVSATAQLLTLGVIAFGLALIVVRAMPEVQPAAFQPMFPNGKAAVGLAAVQLFWAFVGWEAITPLAREFKSVRDIWRASIIAVVVVGVLYLSLAIAVVGTGVAHHGSEAPLVQLAARVFGPYASAVVGIAGYLVCFIPMNAYIAGTSRLVFALGERRQLPAWFGTMNTHGTPVRALAVLFALSMIALGAAWAAGLWIDDLLPYSSASFIATYVLSMAAAVKLLSGSLRWAAVLSLVACTIVIGFVGKLLLWVAFVSVCALLYQRFVWDRAGRSGAAAGQPG